MTAIGGLEQFRGLISGEAMDDLRSWRSHPELGRLVARLEAITDQDTFLSIYAEAVVARHLLARGCTLKFEVPTPSGRSADFGVDAYGQTFFVHVKRVSSDRPVERKLRVSSRLRILERIRRPYIVNVSWAEGLTDKQMQRFVSEMATFITQASVGDEHAVVDDDGRQIGGGQIVAPWGGNHVSLAIGLPLGYVGDSQRMFKLMKRAHRQFMPRAVNVILIAGTYEEDFVDFENALLGSHIERWDAAPPRGQRVAHGRASDGFWSEGRIADSQAAGWFQLAPQVEGYRGRIYLRQGNALDEAMRSTLLRLFETWPRERIAQRPGPG